MTTTPLTPSALAEIRERDASTDAAWFDATIDEGDKEERVRRERDSYRDRRNLLAEVDAEKEISRLTAELAAARKPQGIKLPRAIDSEVATGWTLSPALVRRVWSAYRAMPNAALPETSLTQTEALLLALESLGAQDGGEGKASTCSRWVHGDCMCVKPPGHDGRCDCACYVTEDQS